MQKIKKQTPQLNVPLLLYFIPHKTAYVDQCLTQSHNDSQLFIGKKWLF